MKVFISFNWPVGSTQSIFRASVGLMNKNEEEATFRIGIIEPSNPDIVNWHSTEKVSTEIAESENFYIQGTQEDKLIIESYDKDGSTRKQIIIDIKKEWPADASGGTTVDWSRFY